MLKTLNKSNVAGKRILLRVAYDITLENKNGQWVVPNDLRIRATLSTINYLLDNNCSLVIMGGWIGRPTPGVIEEKFKMDPVAKRLSTLLHKEVRKLDETVGATVEQTVFGLKPREIVLLENTRFIKGETEADPKLAAQMGRLGEYVVYDAFAHAMRVHASTTGLLQEHQQACCAGLLMEKEVNTLHTLLQSPQQPFVVVLGGAKVSDKSGLMYNILDKASSILVGGALANVFLKAQGYSVGSSLVESVFVDEAKGEKIDAVVVAKDLLTRCATLHLPQEVIVARKTANGSFDEMSKHSVVVGESGASRAGARSTFEYGAGGTLHRPRPCRGLVRGKTLCEKDEAILDIGENTCQSFTSIIQQAKTIFWNGPMGLFEIDAFSKGTRVIAEEIARAQAFSIAGGGDTEGVVSKYNLEKDINHLSTGGGAALNMLAGQELPVMKYLMK